MTASTLKWIALVSMLANHIGCLLILLAKLPEAQSNPQLWHDSISFLRSIGRTAFPVFAFLLVEGVRHTRSRKRYAVRLAIFALVSELPHYLFFSKIYATGTYRLNIGFTLLLLFFLMCGYKRIKLWNNGKNRYMCLTAACILLAVTCLAVRQLPIGYGYPGVLLCTIFYGVRHKVLQPILGYFAIGIRSMFRVGYLLPFILLAFYNEKPGKSHKSFFYIFYPGHLLLLWGIYLWMVG